MVWRHRNVRASAAAVLVWSAAACAGATAARTAPPAPASYTAWVANEASDVVTRIVYSPGKGITTERTIPMGGPARIEGPHGLAVAPDAGFWYVTLAHGAPNGRVAKYNVARDSLIASVGVGAFPETIAITPDGEYLFIANHDMHRNAPSGVSIVFAPAMTEVARPVTCVHPAGGGFSAAGTHHYSVCAGSDQLVEIDARTFAVTRRFALTPGREQGIGIDVRGGRRDAQQTGCLPRWVEPGRGKVANALYVTCARTNTILEIDALAWRLLRRIETGNSPYQLDIDDAGTTLLVTLHADSALSLVDIAAGRERASVQLTRTLPHAVAITADGRFAFVTNEGAGTARGTVDVIDIAAGKRVASVDVGYAPGGIDTRRR